MKILYNWLKEFVAIPLAPEELAARLSLAGVAIDAIQQTPAGPVLDAEITTNRPDLLGHLGVAREAAAILRAPFKMPEPRPTESAERADSAARVEITCPDLCGRFTARVLRGVRVGPSPDWLRQRLEALGQTSINNVVDATNCVMFELGHALHAFDLDTLADRRIVVRRANPGEKIRTLDGIERALTRDMCMVADGPEASGRAVGIGGVMGGAETEISSATRNLLLECAWFDPISIRHTSKALNLRTEASIRFERRADPEMAERASRRCAQLIQEIAGGEVLAGVVDVYPSRQPAAQLELTRRELLRVMGADVPDAEIEAILRALGFTPERADGNRSSRDSLVAAWKCTQPSWRHDVEREVDLVEEVARHYGFDKFPPRLPAARQPARRLPHAEAEDHLRERLLALGYQEAMSIPFVDEAHDALFRDEGTTGGSPGVARIANPLAEDASVLRSTGVATMVRALEWNLNRGQRDLRLFEIGRVYGTAGSNSVEIPVLTLGAAGLAREKSVYDTPRTFALEDLKGDLEALLEICGGIEAAPGAPGWLHPGRSVRVTLSAGRGRQDAGGAAAAAIGVAGQLARRVAERCKLKHDVWVAELRLEPLVRAFEEHRAARRFVPLPRFPAVERDFSLVLDDGVTFARVASAIRALGVPEIERIEAVDLFRGGAIPAGKHSLLVRLTLQSHDATLTDAQVSDVSGRVVAALERELGATLRAG